MILEKYIIIRERLNCWIGTKLWARLQYHVLINLWAWYTVKVEPTVIASDVTIADVISAWRKKHNLL